jgi:hypothetical protein
MGTKGTLLIGGLGGDMLLSVCGDLSPPQLRVHDFFSSALPFPILSLLARVHRLTQPSQWFLGRRAGLAISRLGGGQISLGRIGQFEPRCLIDRRSRLSHAGLPSIL